MINTILKLCEFSEDEASLCEKSFSHDSNEEDDLEEEGTIGDTDGGRLSGLNGDQDPSPEGDNRQEEEEGEEKDRESSAGLKGERSPVPEIQSDTPHLNGHLHDTGRISGKLLQVE